MKRYELLYILPATLTEEETTPIATKVTELLQQNGCQISQEVAMEKRHLAYPIKQQRYGYYRLVEFSAEPEVTAKLNDALRLSQEILRHIIVEKPIKSQVTLDREQALRDRLAARRQQHAETAPVEGKPSPAISAEELDQKLSKILEESAEL
ncbi:30S ribosomal protein S6 [Candidatus Uhrbacteria bacterium CG10_big_fil_rev_8_21_14_0_10_48_11]|uniref:Small ribosomal subunit protein bS6 n=1 Tax=Candidatus Uhrbacteria bacterium CG10_big_fil_rev_8_21_14_0_10_48_11 TaxID=1975037 RepID=A0A2M8LDQ1_9BACT|nr:MAG: 30S ribosomal protein S6 [Candidatus Uhrbacteria bacterium CG10_big_fil_rev_8_21_14_0_10_48_11]